MSFNMGLGMGMGNDEVLLNGMRIPFGMGHDMSPFGMAMMNPMEMGRIL